MKYKLFGITWDIRPILVLIWVVIGVGLFISSLAYALEDNHTPAIILLVSTLIWSYVTSTLENNKFLTKGE